MPPLPDLTPPPSDHLAAVLLVAARPTRGTYTAFDLLVGLAETAPPALVACLAAVGRSGMSTAAEFAAAVRAAAADRPPVEIGLGWTAAAGKVLRHAGEKAAAAGDARTCVAHLLYALGAPAPWVPHVQAVLDPAGLCDGRVHRWYDGLSCAQFDEYARPADPVFPEAPPPVVAALLGRCDAAATRAVRLAAAATTKAGSTLTSAALLVGVVDACAGLTDSPFKAADVDPAVVREKAAERLTGSTGLGWFNVYGVAVLEAAARCATDRGDAAVGVRHLLVGIVDSPGDARRVLERHHAFSTVAHAKRTLFPPVAAPAPAPVAEPVTVPAAAPVVAAAPTPSVAPIGAGEFPDFGLEARLVLEAAVQTAATRGDRAVNTAHLLHALLVTPGAPRDVLLAAGLTPAAVGILKESNRGVGTGRFTGTAQVVVDRAPGEAGGVPVQPVHLLALVCTLRGHARDNLVAAKVDPGAVAAQARARVARPPAAPAEPAKGEPPAAAPECAAAPPACVEPAEYQAAREQLERMEYQALLAGQARFDELHKKYGPRPGPDAVPAWVKLPERPHPHFAWNAALHWGGPVSVPVPDEPAAAAPPAAEPWAGYARLTDRARRVMELADQEAQRFNRDHVGTAYVLLGLVREGHGVAANVLKNLDATLDPDKVRREVVKVNGPGTGGRAAVVGRLPHTATARQALEFSAEEADALGDTHVGTEHVLLGLLRNTYCDAAAVLRSLGLTPEAVREEVLRLVGRPLPVAVDLDPDSAAPHRVAAAPLCAACGENGRATPAAFLLPASDNALATPPEPVEWVLACPGHADGWFKDGDDWVATPFRGFALTGIAAPRAVPVVAAPPAGPVDWVLGHNGHQYRGTRFRIIPAGIAAVVLLDLQTGRRTRHAGPAEARAFAAAAANPAPAPPLWSAADATGQYFTADDRFSVAADPHTGGVALWDTATGRWHHHPSAAEAVAHAAALGAKKAGRLCPDCDGQRQPVLSCRCHGTGLAPA